MLSLYWTTYHNSSAEQGQHYVAFVNSKFIGGNLLKFMREIPQIINYTAENNNK